jgi:predicted glycoside hydrolase/deacetylase ChbG (UPF0249 family)
MKTKRREFIQTLGAGAAGLGLAHSLPSVAAQYKAASIPESNRRKMVIQADDVGFSNVCNIGSFKTIEEGVVTTMDVMLADPGTVDALERLTKYPWISVGWHMHMWGAPVLNPKEVPSLVEKGGEFDGRFRTDLNRSEDVVFEEAVRELRAQLDRCIRILGKAPDTGGGRRGDSPWGRAVAQVTEEYGLVYGFKSQPATPQFYVDHIVAARNNGEKWAQYYSETQPRPPQNAEEKWLSRKIVNVAGTTAFIDLLTDSVSKVEAKYDPVLFYTEDRAGILKYPADVICQQSWHPGYVDYYVYRLGERANRARAQQFVVGRVQDVAAMCDSRLKSWIKENNIELINLRDALYGTNEYQNHLRIIGSDLSID